jgi:hypothetical protein
VALAATGPRDLAFEDCGRGVLCRTMASDASAMRDLAEAELDSFLIGGIVSASVRPVASRAGLVFARFRGGFHVVVTPQARVTRGGVVGEPRVWIEESGVDLVSEGDRSAGAAAIEYAVRGAGIRHVRAARKCHRQDQDDDCVRSTQEAGARSKVYLTFRTSAEGIHRSSVRGVLRRPGTAQPGRTIRKRLVTTYRDSIAHGVNSAELRPGFSNEECDFLSSRSLI